MTAPPQSCAEATTEPIDHSGPSVAPCTSALSVAAPRPGPLLRSIRQLRHARLLIGSPVLATCRKLIVDTGIGQKLFPLDQIRLLICQPAVFLGCESFGLDVR